jgi:hypothetical protein
MKLTKHLEILLLAIVSILFLQSFAYAYHQIVINPSENNRYHKVKLGEEFTLTAEGIGWDDKAKALVPNTTVSGINWKFDEKFLKKVNSESNAITFEAIRTGTTKLIIKAKIQEVSVTKTFAVVVTRGIR